ncbi:MAG: hypothetical protein KatS3mg105_2081 [Gemmatales bacterium]|nr:MAG: hypothetical protein KatS3mg105_2081 [Gemmatales bacterium]
MERHLSESGHPQTFESRGLNDSPFWLIVLFALFLWQGWMTLTLFAPRPICECNDCSWIAFVNKCWRRLCNDEPIVSRKHPFHLYFGYLGAEALRSRGEFCCFDPGFQAGFPKTPVFDSGSRPAEVFLFLSGGGFRPDAYKLGIALCCLLAPLPFVLAGWGLGLGRGLTCLVVFLGLLVWWGDPCRSVLEDGDIDLLLASLASLGHVCMLVRFHRHPGLLNWLVLVVTGVVGWFAQPVLFFVLCPFLLVYYVTAGVKHSFPWHVALHAAMALPLLVNAFWLVDWVRYWWLRLPLQLGAEPLRHRTITTVWNSPLWGDACDRALALTLFALAAIGAVILNQSRRRATARLLGLGALCFLVLAVLGISMRPIARLGAAFMLIPSLFFAAAPAAYTLGLILSGLRRGIHFAWYSALFCFLLLAAGTYFAEPYLAALMEKCQYTTPFELGLSSERRQLVEIVRHHTGPEARILWEDRLANDGSLRWSALLPILTGRFFIGGLDPEGTIEHMYANFVDQKLAEKPIEDWSDEQLADFCRRYNIGWVVCWSKRAKSRFARWQDARHLADVYDQGHGQLFSLTPRSYVLKGKARWLQANRQHIALADVVPENGKVVLSLHYQSGLRAVPTRVLVERENDPFDPIPFVRLRVPGPVARVTLFWEKP